jgi:hypothetical protein
VRPVALKPLRRLRYGIGNAYWRVVRRFNRRAFLRHVTDCDPDCQDGRSWQDFLYLETQHWTRRAERAHVSDSDITLPEGSEGHWQRTYDGFSYLPYEPLRKLKKLVEDAEYEQKPRTREGRELWVKYFTAFAAALAAIASLATYFTPRKK